MTTVLGIDPSLTGTGIAVIAHTGGIAVDTIGSKGSASATLVQRYDRLATLAHRITEVATAAWADTTPLIVIEQPAYNSRTGHQHDRSGLWWLLVARLHELDLPVVEVAPSARATYATGKGNAGKDTVLANVVRRYPLVDVQDNNQADALVLAAMGARHLGSSIEESLPQTHLRALDKVVWPPIDAGPDRAPVGANVPGSAGAREGLSA